MKRKKLLVGLLVALGAFSLASCDSNTNPKPTTPTATATAQKTQTDTSTKTQTGTATQTGTQTSTATQTAQKTVVKFNTDGGNAIADAEVTANMATKPANPVKAEYAFAGWFTNTDFEEEFDFTNVTATATAYAKWVKIMTYEELMSAEDGDEIAVGAYIAARQSYYIGGTLYLVNENNEGFFGYRITMTQTEFNTTYTVGSYVVIAGVRTSYSGEVEIASDGSVITKITGKPVMNLSPIDVSEKLNNLTDLQNCYFTATLKVKAYVASGQNVAAASGAYGYNSAKVDDTTQEPYDDLYFILTDGTNDLSCCLEAYLTNSSSEVYAAVKALTVGDDVTVTGYMYWWNGANPHIVTLVVNK